jgi:hypothetical protein
MENKFSIHKYTFTNSKNFNELKRPKKNYEIWKGKNLFFLNGKIYAGY